MVHLRLQTAQAPRPAPSARMQQHTGDPRLRPFVLANLEPFETLLRACGATSIAHGFGSGDFHAGGAGGLVERLAALRRTDQLRGIDEVLTIRTAHA